MRFSFLLYSCAAVTALHAEQPFEFASTPGKLPKQIRPTDYAIWIKPDVKKLTFTGREKVKIDVEQPTHQITLNAADVNITDAEIDGKPIAKNAIGLDAKNELLTISVPEELTPGEHILALKFTGKINQFGRGLFFGKYQEQGTGAKKIFLGTQFEATDARRLFPCWDEPAFRARFQLTTVVPENWMAVSNMPVASEKKVTGGREVEFQLTPSMSSYLVVFCAGEFDAIESEVDGVKLRITTTKGKAESARYALEVTAQILHYYNEYFGIPYPLPKLDQLAIPGGFGGAMENWGGITYYETALLFDPANSSAATKQTIYEVIAHEVAHQWFGDLVTMAWWDNLWLNEGFASWMGTKCTARFNPQWEVWLQKNLPRDPTRRTGIVKEQAMEDDARMTTHAIQQKIETEADANNAFDDITYKKGQSFLRMLESFLGEESFRDGIRRYIQAHKYSNSTTADLWNALSEASGKPVADIATGWTEQPGFPVVSVKRETNNKVALSQERFTINFKDNANFTWKIPLTYLIDGQSAAATLLMSEKAVTLEDVPVDRALKLNVEGAGNYRVAYDESSWKLLLATLPGMNVPDQVNLLSDAWAFVQEGRRPLSFYTDLVDRLPPSTAIAVRDQIINTFDSIDHLLAGTGERESFRSYARSVLRPTLDALGFQPKADEPVTASLLRASLIQQLGLFGDEDVIKTCRQNFDNYLKNPASVAPDLRAPTFAIVMRYGDASIWQKLHELGLKTASTEDKQYYYDALAFAADPTLLQKSLAIALTDELPTSRAVFMVGKVARESDRPDLAWEFAKKNLKPLQAKVDALSVNTYLPGLFPFFFDPARIEELKTFAKTNLSEASRKPVEIASDEIQFRADFRKRLIDQIPSLK
ncbi:MAG TPA: M1 family metallopeptidase [Chthoniobacterales bacterium]|nr:M1 family metallopeptidase [Chthoniobacterales bacterium]